MYESELDHQSSEQMIGVECVCLSVHKWASPCATADAVRPADAVRLSAARRLQVSDVTSVRARVLVPR
eukprot:6197485-Pleurochrysis_carterae.AAC.1